MTHPMVEKMARALHEELAGNDPDELIHHPAQKSWEAPTQPRWMQWEDAARDALRALLEPDEQMLNAMCEVGPDTNSGCFGWDDAENVFTAAIRSLLEEK